MSAANLVVSLPSSIDMAATLTVVRSEVRSRLAVELDMVIGDGGRLERVTDEASILQSISKSGRIPSLTNGDEAQPVILFGLTARHLELKLPESMFPPEDLEDLLGALGDQLRCPAAWCASKRSFSVILDCVFSPTLTTPGPPTTTPHGLPALSRSNDAAPSAYGWINYWPEPVLQRVGWSERSPSAETVYSHHRTDSGAVVLRLTETSLDFDREDHRFRVRAFLLAFPAIGSRDRPLQEPVDLHAADDPAVHPRRRAHLKKLREKYEQLLARGERPAWPVR